MKKILITFATLTLITVLSACTPVRETRGLFLTPEQIAKVQPGATRTDVLQAIGTPTTTSVFDDNAWYYIGQKTEKKAFFDAKVTDRRIFEVRFDANGQVISAQEVDAKAEDIQLATRKTPTSGHSMTLSQQLLGNIGRFNKPTSMPGAE